MAMQADLALISLNRSFSRQREEEQQIELPHNQLFIANWSELEQCYMQIGDHRGDVDWHTLGNIMSAYILGEVVKASYVDYKHGLRARGFEADTDWKFAYEEHDVLVLRKQFKTSPINCFMGRGVIDLPVEQVAQIVGNIDSRKLWDNLLVEAKEIERFSDVDALRYMYHVATRCLVKSHRDFLYYVRSTFVDGKFVHTCLSVEHPILPPQPGIVRAQMRPGCGWVLEPYDGNPSKTLASYLAHLDLMALPAIIVNRVMRRQPMAIYHIRKSLASSDLYPFLTITGKRTDQHAPDDKNVTSACDIQREPYYEEPVSIRAFTSNQQLLSRHHSVPVEVDRHWNGRDQDRAITARPRLISEGSGDASPATTRAQQNARMHSTTARVQERDRNMCTTSAATAHERKETGWEGSSFNHPIPVVESKSCADSQHYHQHNVEKGSKGEQLGNQLKSHGSPNDCEERTVCHKTRPGHHGTNGDLAASYPGDGSLVEAELGLPHIPNELRNGKGVGPPKASFATPGSSVGSSSDVGRMSASPPSVSQYLPGMPLSVTPPADTGNQRASNGPPLYSTTGTSTVGTLVATTTAQSPGPRSLSASRSSLEGTVESQTDGFGTASSGSSFESFHSVSPDTSGLVQPREAFCEGPQEENGLFPWQLQS